MKVFMVHEDPWHAGNPYIYTLMESLTSRYSDIQMGWGRNAFWGEEIFSYDIVHFHWPQAFMAGDPLSRTVDDLILRLSDLKAHGVMIVATCHDLEPHYGQCADFGAALNVVYNSCDAILHLGEYSMSLFKERYTIAKHYLMFHHVYDTVYDAKLPDKEEACRHLGLKSRKKFVLCFGAFRSNEERNLLKYVARHTSRRVHYLAPSFLEMPVLRRRHPLPYIKAQIKRLCLLLFYRIHYTGKSWVPVSDEDLKYYYSASDFAFVHRLRILNSGNAVMPLLFGRRVVGPDTGNVGSFLKSINMSVFDVEDKETAVKMIEKEFSGTLDMQPQIRDFVSRNLKTDVVADTLLSYYKCIFSYAKL